MGFELLIFDLDGTLVDSQHDLMSAVNATRSLYRLPPADLATVRSFVGNGVRVLMEKALPGLPSSGLDTAVQAFKDNYRRMLLETTRLFPGIAELLAGLGKEKTLAVLSNKPEEFSLKILQALDVDRCFAVIRGGDSGPKRKPDPEPVLEIVQLLGKDREKTVIIGDGVNDVLSARNAGVRSLAVGYGYTPEEELLALRPDYFVRTPGEILEIVR